MICAIINTYIYNNGVASRAADCPTVCPNHWHVEDVASMPLAVGAMNWDYIMVERVYIYRALSDGNVDTREVEKQDVR